jgi:tRNA G37 N-methylase TrmD
VTKELEPADTSIASVPERKPYRAPRIEESGEFEHLVLACGRLEGEGDFPCASNPKSA